MFCLIRSHWELKQGCELEFVVQGTLCVDTKQVSDGKEGGVTPQKVTPQKETETELREILLQGSERGRVCVLVAEGRHAPLHCSYL